MGGHINILKIQINTE